jgi:subtilisin family serine protease
MGMGRRLVLWLAVLGMVVPGLMAFAPARPVAARSIEGSVSGTVRAAPNARVEPAQPRLLVRFRPEATAAERAAAVASVGGTVDRVLDAIDVTRIAIPIPSDPQSDEVGLTALRLSKHSAVISVEPDSTGSVQFTPNDPFYLNDPSFGIGQWGLRTAHVDQAWDVVRGSPSITVAVIDTGIDPNHPDLGGVALPGIAFLSSPDPTCAALPPGSTLDDNAHGTHVAGVIAANGNNGVGIAGVAFGVKILPIKALDCQGSGLMSDVATGVMWATDHGARIINISLGSSTGQGTLGNAIRYAVSRGVFVVAAAGNCGAGISARCSSVNEPQYPGAYPESFAVSATDSSDQRAGFSNVATYVAVAAPGARVYSTTPTYPTTLSRSTPGTTTYAAFSGTSQAAPFVAGVAALLLTKDPTLTVQQLGDRLRAGADDLGPAGIDPQYGSGRVNALRALNIVPAPVAVGYGATYDVSSLPARGSILSNVIAPVRLTNTSSFAWRTSGADIVRLGYHWLDLAGKTVSYDDGTRISLPADVPVGGTVTVNASIQPPNLVPGGYVLKLDLVRDTVIPQTRTWFSASNVQSPSVFMVITNGLGASYAPTPGTPSTLVLGANTFPVTVANTGDATWLAAGANPVHLSYHWIRPDGTMLVWDGARASLPSYLRAGQSAVLALPVNSPPQVGPYVLRLDMVQEGVTWFSGQGVVARDFQVNVTNGYGASYKVEALTPQLPGGRAIVPVTLRNDGLTTWAAGGPNPIRLAAHISDATGATVSWDGERSVLPNDVAPGQSVTASVIVNTPPKAGTYTVRVDLVQEGIAWLSSYGVAPAVVGLQAVEDHRATFQITATQVSMSAPAISVTVTNTSIVTWSNTGSSPVVLSAHWLAADGRVLVWDGPRGLLGRSVAPGASVTVNLPLASPPPGAAMLVVDLVAEGSRWFGMGSARPITLVP